MNRTYLLPLAAVLFLSGCSAQTKQKEAVLETAAAAGAGTNQPAPSLSPSPQNAPSGTPSVSAVSGSLALKPLGAAGELASYYDRHLAVKDGVLYGWSGNGKPQRLLEDALQAGVGETTNYALLKDGRLIGWEGDEPGKAATLSDDVVNFSAGKTGVFAVKKDGSLWRFDAPGKPGTEVAKNVVYSSIGDGADYYITVQGDLYVKGLAHRGQYGDGKLESTDDFAKVASNAVQVRGHTGHAIMLLSGGDVQGTGGNIYGPLGTHGLGDKATTWGTIFSGASMIATGSSHSVAVKEDGTLWIWGANEGTKPRKVQELERVVSVAAGKDATLAKTEDGAVWFWRTGKTPEKIL
ncbi:RCC1 domain-containing protein [Paenibacillus sp. MBLB4367]|uniref:RCC1 domain-containing protein n=1 Tax=Paenibacillus sp. MBLB4367 TaxID=3384767 RepID=UPI0039083F24